jgi:diguanylate cyclase (GGDEF)-like protein
LAARPDTSGSTQWSDRLLLRSRFGRRLLAIFLGCALVPTFVIGTISYRSVRNQLVDQAQEHLAVLTQFAARIIHERLTTLEADFKSAAGRLIACSLRRPAGCADSLGYGVSDLALVNGKSLLVLGGAPDTTEVATLVGQASLESGQSVLLVTADRRLALVHRLDSTARFTHLIGIVDPSYLWGTFDDGSLPDPVHLTLWQPAAGVLREDGGDSLRVRPAAMSEMSRSATGQFTWDGRNGGYWAAYAKLPSGKRFGLSELRLVLSESDRDVLAPMSDFTRTFPLLLAAAGLGVLAFGLSQIRRRVIPLHALHDGTRRLAEQAFDTRVEISSGDEIEELADSFNVMATRIGRQFTAVETAAEVDRAVLSLMDRARIVETALERLPDLVPVEGSSLTLLDSAAGSGATVWSREGTGPIHRSPEPLVLSARELALIRSAANRVTLPAEDGFLPAFAEPLVAGGGAGLEIYPLRFGDDVAGALTLRRPPERAADRTDPIQIRHLADQIAVALGNARMVDQVRFLAFYDNLTGLPNRMLYKERLAEALSRAERQGCHVAVCFLDLDQFSSINDSLGHDLGDRLIERVAKRLLAICRDSDTIARLGCGPEGVEVARLGGDEFTVVLPDLEDPQDAARVARRLLDSFRDPFRLGTHEVFVTASIGIAVYPEDGREIDDLVKNADVAMYHAKESGRCGYRMFSPDMNAAAVSRMQLEQRLRRAVEGGEFALVYQPIVDLGSGLVTGAEALVRWNHPDRGVISPAEFISLSEESGLIVRLGEWILRRVCVQARAWQDQGRAPIRLGINLSARQLQDQDILDTIRGILAETGVDPSTLVMELTESVLMRPDGQVADSIRALAEMGIAFSVDDFGTGYSSLSYLKHFPVSSLKIDRAFIRHVPGDQDYAAITTAIVALAGALGMEVVAEGVETEEQARFLLELGCQRAQGYLIGPPVSPEEFVKFLDGQAQLALRPARLPKKPAKVPAHS